MKTLFLLIAATASLSAAPTIGISVPPSGDPVFTKGLPAIRHLLKVSQPSDLTAKSAKENGTEIFAVISTDLDPRFNTGSNADNWRALFVGLMVSNYGKSATHWEAIPPSGLDPGERNSPFRYGQVLTLVRKAAREANPTALIGISIANYNLEFFYNCLKDGAAGQFDFVSLSPFPATAGTERLMPGALAAVRKLLASHDLPAETPVHITLTGAEADLISTAAAARAAGFDQVFIQSGAATLAKIPAEAEPLPPGKSYAEAPSVSIELGETNQPDGLEQILPGDTPWDADLKANRLRLSTQPSVFRTAFLADPTFLTPDHKSIAITVSAKRLPSDDGLQNPTGLNLTYESTFGTRSAGFWTVPGDNEWHTKTWEINDARFVGKLGWNFLLDASGAGNDVLIRETKLSK
jgi:hypothetical protein